MTPGQLLASWSRLTPPSLVMWRYALWCEDCASDDDPFGCFDGGTEYGQWWPTMHAARNELIREHGPLADLPGMWAYTADRWPESA